MVTRVFPIVLLALLLAGCTSNVQMANAKGQVAHCQTTSFGVIGTLVAASMQQACINDFKSKGFHQVTAAAAQPAAAKPTAAAKPAAAKPAAASSGQAKQQ